MAGQIPLHNLRKERLMPAPISNSAPAQIWITNEIRDLADIWPRSTRLGDARCFAFQCAEVLELYCDTFIPAVLANPWFVAIVNESNEPLALFPFMIEYRSHIRTLRFLDGGLSEHNAPVIFPLAREWNAETAETIWRGLCKSLPFDIAVLEKVPEFVGDLRNPLCFLNMSPQGQSSYQLALSETWDELSAKLPRRSELARKSLRLRKRGTISFEMAETPEQYDILVAALLRQKKRRDMELRGYDSLNRPGFHPYLKAARELIYPTGPVAMVALKVNDTIVATQWGYIVGSRFYCVIPSFEAGEWYRYSPFFQLVDHMLEWCSTKGLSTFDFGFGYAAYKLEYCDASTLLYQAEIPATLRGRLYLLLRNVRRKLHKLRPQPTQTSTEGTSKHE